MNENGAVALDDKNHQGDSPFRLLLLSDRIFILIPGNRLRRIAVNYKVYHF